MPSTYTCKRIHNLGRLMKAIIETEIKADNMVIVHRLADFTKTEAFRKQHGLSYTAIYAKAIANVVTRYPAANRRIIPIPVLHKIWPFVQQFNGVDVAVAAERVQEGLENVAFIDIVRDVDTTDLATIHEKIRSLQASDENNNKQWRDLNRVARLPFFIARFLVTMPMYFPRLWQKYRGGSVLISSPGKYGMDTITTSWTSPLGLSYGYVIPRPMVVDGAVVPRLSCWLIMSFDRRLLAGRPAGIVFSEIIDLMENPEKITTRAVG
jgi:pyruvate/2-oxoglutarate dehydrogenase complex dihydrolipoamide acyltransferase (E2) component